MQSLLIVTGWNCEKFVEPALRSIAAQTRMPDHIVIVDDGSQRDQTWNRIAEATYLPGRHALQLPSNYGTVYARHHGIMYAINEGLEFDVIIQMDLDDELMPEAVETVMKVYESYSRVWLTYGNYVDSIGRVCELVPASYEPRKSDWQFIHLRTFRKDLYLHLTDEDLFVPNTPVYPDANMLYCLLEMAGPDHTKVIPQVLYKYNHNQPNSVLNRFNDPHRRYEELSRIKAKKPKKPIEWLPDIELIEKARLFSESLSQFNHNPTDNEK